MTRGTSVLVFGAGVLVTLAGIFVVGEWTAVLLGALGLGGAWTERVVMKWLRRHQERVVSESACGCHVSYCAWVGFRAYPCDHHLHQALEALAP